MQLPDLDEHTYTPFHDAADQAVDLLLGKNGRASEQDQFTLTEHCKQDGASL